MKLLGKTFRELQRVARTIHEGEITDPLDTLGIHCRGEDAGDVGLALELGAERKRKWRGFI